MYDTEINENGGKQSYLSEDYTQIPAVALKYVAAVLKVGKEKYGADNQWLIPAKDHLNHAIAHCFEYLDKGQLGDLTHATCRLLFAVESLVREMSTRERE
jgi:hypothetical protein